MSFDDAYACDFPLRGRCISPPLTSTAVTVKRTSPRFTSSSAILVFRRLNGSTSIRGCEPCNSCLVLNPATMIRRNRESIPGHSPSLAISLKSFLADLLADLMGTDMGGSTLSSHQHMSSIPALVSCDGYKSLSNTKSTGIPRAAITASCNQLIADL